MDEKIQALRDALNECEKAGYAVVTHAWNRLELAVEGEPGGSVYLVCMSTGETVLSGEWVAVGFNGEKVLG